MCHGDNNNGIIDVENQAKVIKTYDPDILLLQEVDVCTNRSLYENQLEKFKNVIGLEYSCYGANIPYKEGWYGNAILSKYPIKSSFNYLTNNIEYSKETKGMLHAEINIEGTIVNVFNTHLSVFEKEREDFAKTIVNIIERNNISGNMILGGDFNFGIIPLGNHRYDFNKKGTYEEYKNIMKFFKDPGFDVNTWPTGKPIADIDKIYYSGDINILNIKRLEEEISDHYPIYAEFEIKMK